DFFRPINDFSGGEKTRIRLIRILLNKYDFVLFDEPTNHLDLVTVDWFITYLKNYEGGYLIVSHDRYLLDQTVNKIYELRNGKVELYSGNYTGYEMQVIEREKVLEKQYNQQQKLIKETEDFIAKNIVRDSTANRAKSRIKMLNKLDRIELQPKSHEIKIKIEKASRSGNDIYRLRGLNVGFADNVLLENLHLDIHYRDKICFVGANGSGKTTLLKILNDDLKPLSGELWTGYSLSVGYYDQLHVDLNEDITVLETIWNMVPGETFGYVMTYLARFGFYTDSIEQRVGSLSGGEKSRLLLAQLIHEKPNLLILDEPTNHLDISMIKSLEQALKDYDGTLIIVSHDRYFLQAITDHYWVFKDKDIKASQESFDVVLDSLRPYQKENKRKSDDKINPKTSRVKKPNAYQLNQKLQEIDSLTAKITDNEATIYQLQQKFSDPAFYTKQDNISMTNKEIAALQKEIFDSKNRRDILENEYLNMIEEE
ncbi:MAG: ATP-binding cassette domain-containing protein, partial [Candidatus Cloacimonetes bacterium]|nr:ATP-binding cassette domain-containing protein [Candidatus Cloacimonadota bacterium]